MNRNIARCAAPSLLLAALVLVPFADKAFTIDDTLFLFQSRQLLVDPLHPTAFETVWSEQAFPMRASRIMPSGPVMAWLLVPSVLAGGSEPVAHLTQLAAMALALVATVGLALRLGLAPRWATVAGLLLAATPAALAMAGTAMPDVPAMALGVAGLERLVAWRDHRRLHQAILAALLLGLAPLARSHLVLLLGVGALLVAGDYLRNRDWRTTRWTAWLPLVVAPALTAAIMLVTRDPVGGASDLADSASRYSGAGHLPRNVVSFATHWVLALPLAVPWIAIRAATIWRRWWVFAIATGAAGALLIVGMLVGIEGLEPMLVFTPVAGVGATVFADIFADAWARRDSLQLTLALWLLVALPITVYLNLPSKYLLASAPAASLLIAREMGIRGRPTAARVILPVVAVLGVTLGIAILRADSAFAGLSRHAAAELIAPNVAAGHRVWFVGHWGFQWYAEKAGARIVTLVPPHPASGDLIVTSLNAVPSKYTVAMLRRRSVTHLRRVEDRRPGGRIMSFDAGAGFFSNSWGSLPWGWGDDPIDVIDLWRVD